MGEQGLFAEYLTIGEEAYQQEQHALAIDWFQHALQAAVTDADRALALDYVAFSYFKLDDVARAIEYTEQALALNPTNFRLLNNIAFYKQQIAQGQASAEASRVSAGRHCVGFEGPV